MENLGGYVDIIYFTLFIYINDIRYLLISYDFVPSQDCDVCNLTWLRITVTLYSYPVSTVISGNKNTEMSKLFCILLFSRSLKVKTITEIFFIMLTWSPSARHQIDREEKQNKFRYADFISKWLTYALCDPGYIENILSDSLECILPVVSRVTSHQFWRKNWARFV